MTNDFLEVIKKVAKRYGISVEENVEEGGIFYRNENEELVKVPKSQSYSIMNEFCSHMGIQLKSDNVTFEVNEIISMAA